MLEAAGRWSVKYVHSCSATSGYMTTGRYSMFPFAMTFCLQFQVVIALVHVIDLYGRDLRSSCTCVTHAQQNRHVAVQQRTALSFRFEGKTAITGRQVVTPQLDGSPQHLLELLVGQAHHLPCRVPDAVHPLSQSC